MNAKLAPIFTRRSVRRYSGEAVTDAEIRDLLEAAMAAPSACAKDPWHFIVVRGRAALDKMADVLPNGPMLRQADAAIVVCGDLARAHRSLESYLIQDCSAAVENILLAATSLGLGACWLGVHPREQRIKSLTEILSLPASVIPVACISIGRPGEKKEPRTRFNADYVHFDRW